MDDNGYDNWLGAGNCWHGDSERQRRALDDVYGDQIVEGTCLHRIEGGPE